VVLITGASSGIGAACAQRLAAEGDRVYGTSRHPGDETDASGVQILAMDVNSDESVAAAIEQIVRAEGRIDVAVNNAGFGIAGAIEDTSIEEAKALFETNFFGMLRVCRAVLPVMRAAHSGTIVNTSSLGGRIGLPYQGLYSATKFAVEGMSEALRMEVRQFGIHVTMIEPGDFRTGFTRNRRYVAAAQEDSAYKGSFERTIKVAENDEQGGSSPEQIARLLVRILRTRSPKVRYSVGGISQRSAAVLKQILPSRVFEWALMKYYKVA
ncbi:MAG TPA: SDR family oxidoreductase, partial [Candidatus Acetothermia bacterium]|nr:SDR family oxidoreductase [Candidatus Acetothermia bacterium]